MVEEEKRVILDISDIQPIRDELEKRNFKFTDESFKGAGYLFPDGKYLNLSSKENRSALDDGGSCVGIIAHHQLDRYIINHKLISDEAEHRIYTYNQTLNKPYFICVLQERLVEHTDGAIVLNDGTNYKWENCYIDLPVEHRPTVEQLNKLTLWIDDIIYSKTPRLDVGFGPDVTTYMLDTDEHPVTEDIIRNIKKLYHMI